MDLELICEGLAYSPSLAGFLVCPGCWLDEYAPGTPHTPYMVAEACRQLRERLIAEVGERRAETVDWAKVEANYLEEPWHA